MRPATRAFLFLLFAATIPVHALAQNANHLTWQACSGSPSASATQTFACNANEDSEGLPISFQLVGSFVPPFDMPDFVGLTAVLDVVSSTAALPEWWRFGANECREGAMAAGTNYGSLSPCTNPFAGDPRVLIASMWQSEFGGSPWRGRLRIDAAGVEAHAILAGTRYVAFRVTLDATRTIDDGTPACIGCCTPVCLVFTQVEICPLNGFCQPIDATDERSFAGWNGQASPSTPGGCYIVGGCPTRSGSRTWGSIKSLYR